MIDHKFFPHIVDLIFSHLTYPGLVACARSSKIWKEKVKARLLQHVAIFECDNNIVVIYSRHASWPDITTRLIAAEQSNYAAFKCVIETSKTVDIFQEITMSGEVTGPPSTWPSRFSRLFGALHRPTHRGELVDQFHLKDIASHDVTIYIDYYEGRYLFQTNVQHLYPAHVDLVVNCYSDPVAPLPPTKRGECPNFSGLVPLMAAISSVTITLNNCIGDKPPIDSKTSDARESSMVKAWETSLASRNRKLVPQLGAVCELMELSVSSHYADSFDIIGLEAFIPTPEHDGFLYDICTAVELETNCSLPFHEADMCLVDFTRSSTRGQYNMLRGAFLC